MSWSSSTTTPCPGPAGWPRYVAGTTTRESSASAVARPAWEGGAPGLVPARVRLGRRLHDAGLPATATRSATRSARTCVPHDVLREAGGFCEDLGRVGTPPVGCEETEISIRLAQAARGADPVRARRRRGAPGHRRRARPGTTSGARCSRGHLQGHRPPPSAEPLGTERDYVTRTLPAPSSSPPAGNRWRPRRLVRRGRDRRRPRSSPRSATSPGPAHVRLGKKPRKETFATTASTFSIWHTRRATPTISAEPGAPAERRAA